MSPDEREAATKPTSWAVSQSGAPLAVPARGPWCGAAPAPVPTLWLMARSPLPVTGAPLANTGRPLIR